MKSIERLMRGFGLAVLLGGLVLGIASCGEYALFKVQIKTSTPPKDKVELRPSICKLWVDVISGDKLEPVLSEYAINTGFCGGGADEAQNVGELSYSTSNIGGKFVFTVKALAGPAYEGKVVQEGKSDPTPATTGDEITVKVTTVNVPQPTK